MSELSIQGLDPNPPRGDGFGAQLIRRILREFGYSPSQVWIALREYCSLSCPKVCSWRGCTHIQFRDRRFHRAWISLKGSAREMPRTLVHELGHVIYALQHGYHGDPMLDKLLSERFANQLANRYYPQIGLLEAAVTAALSAAVSTLTVLVLERILLRREKK